MHRKKKINHAKNLKSYLLQIHNFSKNSYSVIKIGQPIQWGNYQLTLLDYIEAAF